MENLTNTGISSNNLQIAVLIDADNIPYKSIKGILEEVTRYGTPTIKRIYGDWTNQRLSGWKPLLLENAISPIQQYGYTTGKNATDSALIIDAMDMLYTKQIDGFCLVSSDSDFTRLATRLREAGKWVLGVGERKTPSPFIVACDKFVYIEVIDENNKANLLRGKDKTELVRLITSSINDSADDSGYAFLADVGNSMMRKQPDFDPRNYGYFKLTPLLKDLEEFEVDERKIDDTIKHVYIRNKRKKK
ncbi:MAG TPA: NYN domain-containing protein [Erysipelotrichaceae bacterium]|nr:NYN domain-containing protein [Erysipelotrichaceae bacterium]